MTLRKLLESQDFKRIGLKKLLSGHYALVLKLNGKPASFILDTGASASCIGFERIDRFGLIATNTDMKATGAGASMLETHLAHDVRLELTNTLATTNDMVLFDLSHVNGALKEVGENEVDGILGGEILKHFRSVIDYGRNALYVKKSS
ncbi:hypothetical protein BST85_10155 [Aureitalea marina]|uniref:Acid protease n=1 Tax=Aureitalea marina TaxID=930804 RepID=A0A2S7KRE7_9FLAO|nr:hypothetical protein BST85_10155 [Aureitalea marina]